MDENDGKKLSAFLKDAEVKVVWREEEMIGTEMLCKGVDDKVGFYCLARGAEEDTIETFYRLVFDRRGRKETQQIISRHNCFRLRLANERKTILYNAKR